jgi:DNA-binding beta-propeller fold protein YncE
VRSFGVGAQAVAVDRADGDVFVGFGEFVEEFDGAGGLVSRFGGPVLGRVGGLAVDEASGEVFVTDEDKGVLDLFGAAAAGAGGEHG